MPVPAVKMQPIFLPWCGAKAYGVQVEGLEELDEHLLPKLKDRCGGQYSHVQTAHMIQGMFRPKGHEEADALPPGCFALISCGAAGISFAHLIEVSPPMLIAGISPAGHLQQLPGMNTSRS